MIIKNNRQSVSEVIGTIILLGISISLFSIVQFTVFSYPFEPSTPSVNIVGSIDQGNILLEHYGGESLSLNTKILFEIDNSQQPEIIVENNLVNSDNDNQWEIGEILSYTPSIDISGKIVRATVIDVKTNSVVMMSVING